MATQESATRPDMRHAEDFMPLHGDYHGSFLPGFQAVEEHHPSPDEMLLAIDHIVGNVELGHMEEWVSFYERVFGMTEMIHFSDEDISTEYSALMSKVVTDG